MKPKLVDLFCGIGLGALGFLRAGFEVIAAVDNDGEACKLYERNVGIKPIEGDLRKISGRHILEIIGAKRGEIDLVCGCPPCQGFSSLRMTRLGKKKKGKNRKDARKSFLKVFAQRIDEIYPKAFVLENVRGLTFRRNTRYLREFLAYMRRLGYSCKYAVLDAADYGVPQRRKRLIVIGSRVQSPELPKPTHSDPALNAGRPPWITVREAIGNLPRLSAGRMAPNDVLHSAADHSEAVLKIIRHIPHDGGSRRSLPQRLWLPCHKKLTKHERRGAESIYGRMRWAEPSPTITTRFHTPACGRFVHPNQNRGISIREAARLQSAPDDLRIAGSKDRMAMWIGNGFPPLLSEAIGFQAKACLNLPN
jgi:DNA (cytosine-5)-methyltransferase 1